MVHTLCIPQAFPAHEHRRKNINCQTKQQNLWKYMHVFTYVQATNCNQMVANYQFFNISHHQYANFFSGNLASREASIGHKNITYTFPEL